MEPLTEWTTAELRDSIGWGTREWSDVIDELLRRERERCVAAAATASNAMIFRGEYPEVTAALQAVRELK